MTVFLLALSVVLAGCSNNDLASGTSDGNSDSGDKKSNEKVTLRFATWDSGEALKLQQEIAKKFEAENPGVKVQVEPYSDGFDQKLAASFGAKNPPDVMYMWNYTEYYKSLEPLDHFIEQDSEINIDDFYEGLFNYSSVNNQTYGLPLGFTTHVVYYNKDLFDKAGVPYPKDGWTVEDFKEKAEKLTNVDKRQYGFGVEAEPDPYDIQGYVWSNGGSFISPDGKKIEGYMNSPETVGAIQMLGDLVKDKKAVLVGGNKQQSGDDIFKAGKIAMYESGIWPLKGYQEAGINFGTVEIPSFDGKPVKGIINTSAISMAKDSKNKDLAWEFIKFFVSPEAIKMRTSDLPVRKSVVQETKVAEDPLYEPFYTMLERSSDTPAFLLNENWSEVKRNLSLAINATMLGKDAEKYLNKAVKDSKKFLKE